MSFTDAQRRFTLVDTPVSPGYCRGCLGDKQTQGLEYLIDLGFSDEQGVIYLCNRCLKEMANLFGFYQRTQKMDNLVIDLERQVHEYEFQFGVLRDAGIDIDRVLASIPNDTWPATPDGEGTVSVSREGSSASKSDHGKGPDDLGPIGRIKFGD